MLASAAAHRSLLIENIGHFQRIIALAHGVRCALAPSAVPHIFAMAARDQQISIVTQALLRVHAKLDTEQLDGLVAVEGRHHGALVCRKLQKLTSDDVTVLVLLAVDIQDTRGRMCVLQQRLRLHWTSKMHREPLQRL